MVRCHLRESQHSREENHLNHLKRSRKVPTMKYHKKGMKENHQKLKASYKKDTKKIQRHVVKSKKPYNSDCVPLLLSYL